MAYTLLILDLEVDAPVQFLSQGDKPLFFQLEEQTVHKHNKQQHEANHNDHILKSEYLDPTDISQLHSIGLDLEVPIVHVKIIDKVILPSPIESVKSCVKVLVFSKDLGQVLLDHFEVHSVVLVIANIIPIESCQELECREVELEDQSVHLILLKADFSVDQDQIFLACCHDAVLADRELGALYTGFNGFLITVFEVMDVVEVPGLNSEDCDQPYLGLRN